MTTQPPAPFLSATRVAALSVPASTVVAVPFDTTIIDQYYDFDDPSAKILDPLHPSRMRIGHKEGNATFGAGVVFIAWGAAVFDHVADMTRRLLAFRVNGVSDPLWQDSRPGINSANQGTALRTEAALTVNAGDYVELIVEQESVGARNILSAQVALLGPVFLPA